MKNKILIALACLLSSYESVTAQIQFDPQASIRKEAILKKQNEEFAAKSAENIAAALANPLQAKSISIVGLSEKNLNASLLSCKNLETIHIQKMCIWRL